MFSQFLGLERRTARGGRDSIDHAPSGHDDIANCVAGALVLAYAGRERRGALACVRHSAAAAMAVASCAMANT
jgi:hypothetical protein